MSGRRDNGDGSIYRDVRIMKDGTERTYWKASVRWQGTRKTVSSRSEAETKRKLKKLIRDNENGTAPNRSRQTFGDFLSDWLESTVRPTTRPRTYLSYEERLRLHVLPRLGGVRLSALEPRHLQQLYADKMLNDGLSGATLNGIHIVVHRALKQALRWGLVARNVADLVDAPQPAPYHPMPLNDAELDCFVAGTREDLFGPLWTLLLCTGMRFGEVSALRRPDVDFDQRILYVRNTITREGNKGYAFTEPKTAKSRRAIPLPAAAIAALQRQKRIAHDLQRLARPGTWTELDLVFPSAFGTPLRESHLIEIFHATLERLGLPRRRIHDLRHTYATRLFALDTHPRAVQDLLGHSRFDITMDRYTESLPRVLREAADGLDAVFGS
jgi:integrase